ncbi:MAG: s-adenosyl-l-methionine-dependent methyltransferase, partial [Verrucomicrobiales bacterium]|nr:s-adenosyl-l-methionine-dependent methyltransferase [Verrucomicrobiales bacterium]
YRLIHSDSDGFPGIFLDRFDGFAVIQGEKAPPPAEFQKIERELEPLGVNSFYFKQLKRKPGSSDIEQAMPRHLSGKIAPDRFSARENGLHYNISFVEGYSVGIFLDQRENRRRLLSSCITPGWNIPPAGKVLNTFAYTCAFSVAAARAGHQVTSLDLSSKYLDWGKQNFALNDLPLTNHDFIFGDTFSWLKRFRNKSRLFDLILLDPPTFSRSRESGVFQVEKDYGRLVASALAVLSPRGILFASTNSATLHPDKFMELIKSGVSESKRKILKEQFYSQPPEFPTNSEVAPYLKTVWLQLD